MSETGVWQRVASVEDIAPEDMIAVAVDDLSIAIYRLGEDEFRATDNICTHGNACLTEGWLEDGFVECPLHGGRFDVRTGKGCGSPITEDLRTFPVRLDGGEVYLLIAEATGGAGLQPP